ncbi:WD repeat-containing protein 18-like [Panonychus citri]|uniref:WD repeat-containing protein 18-like n=2 Tax=Panonychus citri TaxID=50023 RepID=UPI002306DD1D|nr:WD repeat-containing protein 18-like [Panonychus citri]
MSAKQVILTSTLNSTYWSVNVQDLLTGTQITSFKETIACGYNSLACLFDQYLICSQKDSSVVHLWSLRKKSIVRTRMKCPANVTALTVTPDGMFIILALGEKIYIYMTSSGQLCSILERHYQPITVIRMSKCGSFFISGGEDGLVLLWMLNCILSTGFHDQQIGSTNSPDLNPKHTWSHHNGRVTDIHCGYTGIRGKSCSVSIDSTCKIYDNYSGNLLISISFDEPLWSVAMDPGQSFLFVGGEKGNIYETKLYDEKQIINDLNRPQPTVLTAHSSKVTHLAISIDGLALISGGYDGKVIVWHTISKQRMKTFENRGAITNLIVMPTPRGILEEETPLIPVKSFKLTNDPDLDAFDRDLIHTINDQCIPDEDEIENNQQNVININQLEANDEEPESNPDDIEKIKTINQQIYEYSVNTIFKQLINK